MFDYSPDTTGAEPTATNTGEYFVNNDAYQNFGERILLGSGATITGMDIYTGTFGAQLGEEVTIRVWADLAGLPDAASMTSFVTTITALDDEGFTTALYPDLYTRAFADFGANSFWLAANTPIWIGMSGHGGELGLLGLKGPNAPGDGSIAQFINGTVYSHQAHVGDMAMRLHGVADSGSLIKLLAIGLVATVALRRRLAA